MYKWCSDRFSTLWENPSEEDDYDNLLLVWINRKNCRFFMGARNWLPLRIKGQKSDGRLQIWCSIQLSLHKEPPEVGLVKKLMEVCISGWYGTCQPYIESTTVISDNRKIFTSKWKREM